MIFIPKNRSYIPKKSVNNPLKNYRLTLQNSLFLVIARSKAVPAKAGKQSQPKNRHCEE